DAMPINLQPQSHPQNIFPSVAISLSDNADVMFDAMGYRNTGNYTDDHASYQGNSSDYTHPGNIDTMNGQLNLPNYNQVEIHTNNSCPIPISFQTLCGPSVPYSDTTNGGPTDNYSQHFDRQVNLQAQSHAPMNTMDYESTGYQSNPSVSCIHPGNLDTMNGRLNPPSHNQVETHTNNSYQLPVSFPTFCGSSVHRYDMTNNGPTDNHFRSISYILTPIPTQAFNSSNVINEPTSPGYFLVTKVEETPSVISAADIGEMLAKLI
ncbi:4378_t:CDS:2, partial [Paraglomus brasilianum]